MKSIFKDINVGIFSNTNRTFFYYHLGNGLYSYMKDVFLNNEFFAIRPSATPIYSHIVRMIREGAIYEIHI